MHFTSNNLLHDFPNGKCMLFSLLNFFFINHVKNIRANPTRPATYFNPFKMTHFLLLTHLTWPNPPFLPCLPPWTHPVLVNKTVNISSSSLFFNFLLIIFRGNSKPPVLGVCNSCLLHEWYIHRVSRSHNIQWEQTPWGMGHGTWTTLLLGYRE